MAFNANEAKGGGGPRQEQVPVGNYPARLVQLVDLGLQAQRPYKGVTKDPIEELRVVYELPTELCVDEDGNPDPTKPRWLGEEFGFYNLKADRAKSTQRYNAFDPTGDHGGDWTQLIGAACTLTVVHNPKKDDPSIVYANIGSIAPPMKGFEVPPLVNDSVVWSLDDPDMEVFEKFPDFLKKKICSNLNFKGSILEQKLSDGGGTGSDPKTQGNESVSNPYG